MARSSRRPAPGGERSSWGLEGQRNFLPQHPVPGGSEARRDPTCSITIPNSPLETGTLRPAQKKENAGCRSREHPDWVRCKTRKDCLPPNTPGAEHSGIRDPRKGYARQVRVDETRPLGGQESTDFSLETTSVTLGLSFPTWKTRGLAR